MKMRVHLSGDVTRGEDVHVGTLNNPTFNSLDATLALNAEQLRGRNLGVYFPTALLTTTAAFNFQFFDPEESNVSDCISASFGFSFLSDAGGFTNNAQPIIILDGSGKYSGLVGTIQDTVEEFVPTEKPAEVNFYTLCPAADPNPSVYVQDECTEIYEWSTEGSIGDYNFSGSTLAGQDDHIGIFDTPFFFPPNVEDSPMAGCVMGAYFLNDRGVAVGQWNFRFFGSTEDGTLPTAWLSGNLGFGGEGAEYPDVVTGGSGDWTGFLDGFVPLPSVRIQRSFYGQYVPKGKALLEEGSRQRLRQEQQVQSHRLRV